MLDVPRAADRGLGEQRRQRAPDERADRDDLVAAVLAGDREVVDVQQRELGAPADDELRAVGALAGLADPQPDAAPAVVTFADGAEDRRLDGVGREIQRQRDLPRLGGRSTIAIAATRRDQGRQDGEGGERARSDA